MLLHCFEWKSSYLPSNNVYANSVSHPIHMAVHHLRNKHIQINKGENLCARFRHQGLARCDKRTYWSRFHWSLACLEACSSQFASVGHSVFSPNPTRTHICPSLSGLLLWALSGLQEQAGLNHMRGQQATHGKDGACQYKPKVLQTSTSGRLSSQP